MGKKADKLTERDLHNWNLLREFRACLRGVFAREPMAATFSDPKRQLAAVPYLSLFLFGLFNPVVRTMRGLCQASHLQAVQEQVCDRPVSPGSFSETQHALDPRLLELAFNELSEQLPKLTRDSRLGQWEWLAQDGSLFRALPRMAWALYGGGKAGAPNRAVKLHLSLNLIDDKPQIATVRPGKVCERAVWRGQWEKGHAYVGDRCFGQDYRLFGQLQELGCAYVLRLRELQVVFKVIQELPLTQADREAGVMRQAWVELGCKQKYRSVLVRLVWIQTKEGSPLMLVTNLTPEELPAELASVLYRQRWKIELFFRWIKCILGARHWLAESPAGVTIQVYLVLIAALLLQLYTGRKPNKRMMELLQLHQMGIASQQELIAGLERERSRIAKRKSD